MIFLAERFSPKLRKGHIEPVKIVVENRQGGRKHVTHISGLDNFR